MPLSWNEIRDRSLAFSRDWADAESERAESQSFWNAFFHVFGIERRRVAVFEKQVALARPKEKLKHGRIDAFWKGQLLIEHKSAGQDLDRAFGQAADYFQGLAERDLPRYILVSDFKRFRLYDLEKDQNWEFPLKDLSKHIKRFGFIAGYQTQEIREQDPVNVRAAERMGKLHDQLKASGYSGHALEVLLVRMLFCLFADDTGIFPKQTFREYIENRTGEDGTDLGQHLALLFQILNTPEGKRQSTLDEALTPFPYVNGKLFEELLPLASFNAKMRQTLLDCAALDWSLISPAVFGALFQSVMDEKARRNLGAHYTSERNILKLIKPLFLDELYEEFGKVRKNLNRLFEFHKKLRTLAFLDPACGCGNFLVIAYRELRTLELEVLRAALALEKGQQHLSIFQLVQVNVDQFHGIEIEEFPAQIAQVALWLADHQMNQRVSDEFGQYYARLPLVTSPNIVIGNALRVDWENVVPKDRLSWILGNPPFVGKKEQTREQKADLESVTHNLIGAGVLDLVAGWYVKAAEYVRGTPIEVGFVSTNSITQGEQVGVLWGWLLNRGIHIGFAHRTFQWSNEARGVAAVHCVIIGFSASERLRKVIYDYDDLRGEPHAVNASHINPYLVDALDVVVVKRGKPICDVPEMRYGSMALDNGHFLFTSEERAAMLSSEPGSEGLLRPFIGGEEFLNNGLRWCLWLDGVSPSELKRFPTVLDRVEKVRSYRSGSNRETTKKLAEFPTLFGENRQPTSAYLLIPKVSSERRRYLPIGICEPSIVASGSALIVPKGGLFELGVLSSMMHFVWMKYTGGRLKSDFQYSSQIVYNNFPWPRTLDRPLVKAIEGAGQAMLEARSKFPGASLADLYDPVAMPPEITRAHQALDKAVDAAYLSGTSRKGFSGDSERVAFLFQLYQSYTSLPVSPLAPNPRRTRKSAP